MNTFMNPSRSEWKSLIARPVQDFARMEAVVSPIMEQVRSSGDQALVDLTAKFDGVQLSSLKVTDNDMKAAENQVDSTLRSAIQVALGNIQKFHQAQKTDPLVVETMPGIHCSQKAVAIEKVGLYVPGGTAPLFSTVLMLGVPAKIAGCQEIVLCTPPGKGGKIDPTTLYTANLVGINQIFNVGGAQAIAAMTFGTETIPSVDKLFGPGNQYVTAAKQLATKYGVAIDMPAGPSEVAVLADGAAIPAFVAADLLSQAEHGVDSQVLLVVTSQEILEAVQHEIKGQLDALPRKRIAEQVLENSVAVVMEDQTEAVGLLNRYAAEHLILAVENAREIAGQIRNAGSVFLGNYTPESAGDYASGTNHTLPTNGYARAYSGVSLDSFMKKITYQEITPEGLNELGPVIESMAIAEQLQAHKEAVSVRLKYLENDD